MIIPSILIVPGKYNNNKLISQIPVNESADFTVSRLTTATRVNSNGLINLVTNNVPRIDYLNQSCPALLVEPAATNQIRNNSMVGAVAGTPGTLPTNWIFPAAAGLTREIVGIGTENGISYIDIKLSGTATGAETEIRLESPTQIVAANGQTWTESIYLKSISQPAPPVSYRLFMIERTIGGTVVTTGLSSNLSLNTSLNRFSFTRTLAGGPTVERVQPSIFISLTSGASYDFTIRIGYPQMEQSPFATSVIPTTSGTGSRDADVISASGVSGLIGQTEGTVYAEFVTRVTAGTAAKRVLTISDGNDGNNRISIGKAADDSLVGLILNGGVTQVLISTAANQSGTFKMALAFQTNDAVLYINGVQIGTNNLFTMPTGFNRIDLGQNAGNAFQFNDRIRAAALYTTRLSNNELQLLTKL